MTSIISQNFNTGPNGAAASVVDMGASSITGTAPTYDNTDPIEGAFCLYFTGASTGSVRWDYAASALVWHAFYFKTPSAAPTGNMSLATWYSGATQVGSLRLQTDMTMAIRDVASATVQTASGLPPNTWCRVAFKSQPGSSTGHVARIYVGSNVHGTSPDYTLTTTATNAAATATDNVRIGVLTAGGAAVYVDRLRSDDAVEPAGMTVATVPSVNAGPDLTKETGSGPFTITAVESTSSTITARTWRVVSGTSVTLSGTTTATVTVTPPATTGTTVLGYTATNATGTSTEDTVTITWVAPGQSFSPTGDVAVNGWSATPTATPLASNIDELVPDTSDYVSSPNNPTGQEYRTRLTAKAGPATTSGVYLELALRLSAAATSQSTVVKLYDSDGTTVRKTWTITDLTTSWSTRQLTLTSAEVSAITGWTSGLVVGIAPTVS